MSDENLLDQVTFYEATGGDKTYRKLVHYFYQNIQNEPLVSPMYPAEDLQGAEDRLRMFLVQFWGGPTDYSKHRGHPHLRMSHQRFKITPAESKAWLDCMRKAIDRLQAEEKAFTPQQEKQLWDYFIKVAEILINSH